MYLSKLLNADNWFKKVVGEIQELSWEQEEIVARTLGFMYILDKNGEIQLKEAIKAAAASEPGKPNICAKII
jgi:hypothetical protein